MSKSVPGYSAYNLVMVTQAQIQDMADRIAHAFKPDRVILFGSYAYGHPTPDSDVDLLVVMPYDGKAHHKAAAIRGVLRPDIPKDVLVRSEQDLEERLSIGDGFIREITQRGRILYDAAHSGVG